MIIKEPLNMFKQHRQTMQQRINYIDRLKGLAILLVVIVMIWHFTLQVAIMKSDVQICVNVC